MVALRGEGGRLVSQVPVPIDPQPALPPGPAATNIELPGDFQIGRPAIIRGRSDGRLRGKTVEVGGSAADLLAISPRQVVFRATPTSFGMVPIRLTDNGRSTDGMTRAVGVRLTATNAQLVRGQRATLTATVAGLGGITEPVTLSFRNLTPAIVQIEGRETPITIRPGDVNAAGTHVETRRLTGLRAGAFQIVASVARSAFSRFDVASTINSVINSWEVRARFRIGPEARELIQRSVFDARRPLEVFLRQQEVNGADSRSVFQSLLSHYCYDLRDDRLSRARTVEAPLTRQPLLLAAVRQQPVETPEVTASEVRRWSFTQFLSDLVARASSQSIGYLFVTSSPERFGITIDGQRKAELTNRRFVTSVGKHDVHVNRPSKPCRVSVAIDALQTSVVACE
jgi:hypothetical protein